MGYHARASATPVELTEADAASLVPDAPQWQILPDGPISGCVRRNGKLIPFTLETANMTPEANRILPEQLIIAGVLVLSFLMPICHLVG